MYADHGNNGNGEPVVPSNVDRNANGSELAKPLFHANGAAKTIKTASAPLTSANSFLLRNASTISSNAINVIPMVWSTSICRKDCQPSVVTHWKSRNE